MSIWARFRRVIRSIFGGAISAMENPRLILEQNIRELNDQVPKMNETIAQVKSTVIRYEKTLKRAQGLEAGLTSKIKAAIRAGRQDLAREYAIRLDRARNEVQETTVQLQQAKMAYEKALQVKDVFMRERRRKIEEANHALRAHERAKMQSEVAGVLEQFEVAGVDQTHDEMIARIDEETARGEARMEVALDSVDTQAMRLEQDSEAFLADEIVRQFELDMQQETERQTPEDSDPAQSSVEKSLGFGDHEERRPPMKRVR